MCVFSEVAFKESLEGEVKNYLKQYNTPGLAIGVVKQGFDQEVPYKKIFCFGEFQRGGGVSIKESTIFRIGCLSRALMATLLAAYLEEKKVEANASIVGYLPKTFATPKFHGEEIKLVQLALNSSSLPPMPLSPMKYYQSSEKEIECYFKKHPLQKKPGTKYISSDLGYGLLSLILSRVGKKLYQHLLEEKVLIPLKLQDTYYSLPLSKKQRLAVGHKGMAPLQENFVDREGSFFKPVRGIYSTIEDQTKFLSFLLKIDATPLEHAVKHLYKYQFEENGIQKSILVAKTVLLSSKKGLTTYKEGGSYQGFSQTMAWIVDTKTGVVILSNSENDVDALAMSLLNLLNS